ncbi:hypothetical protein ROA7450_01364 [Roseovarius albus]|uniref:UPF0246 protein ROA7450_01364 n=1 Tax=Roseovarius albus TaxID=1247867 RepID=A0A1X6YTR5_9RHOB|nr:peroxide stress protein YaaA [Roseovarius albus]SLN30985.1 hypothetical protein ROA7450_01364 [Roseovarius albus]
MQIVISPAKKMDMNPVEAPLITSPQFQKQADELALVAKSLTAADLGKLMKISQNLAAMNAERFQSFGTMGEKPAALAFAGDTYQGLEASSLDHDELNWAQDHLGILSGLYGLLRPLDAIQPYRLEMGSRLKNPRGKNLYEYWGDTIAMTLNDRAERLGSDVLVNCASQEYFGAVDLKALKPCVITPVFMEDRNGTAKIVSFYAKKARGAMARYIIQHRLTDPKALLDFDTGGYAYQPDMSEPDKPVFLRDYPTP